MMTKWKLTRQFYGSDEYTLSDGDEVTIGRGVNNTIRLTSFVVSRQHCVINVYHDKVTIKDLKSANGTFVSSNKIPTDVSFTVNDSDIVGFGWSETINATKIADAEKFIFQLVREKSEQKSIGERIKFETIEKNLHLTCYGKPATEKKLKLSSKLRKGSDSFNESDGDNVDGKALSYGKKAILLSDSNNREGVPTKKIKLESTMEEQNEEKVCDKEEVMDNDYEFSVKEEWDYDEGPICVDSDSDGESERWFLRLSQSSPGKPFIRVKEANNLKQHESSYSQTIENDDIPLARMSEDEYLEDLITIPDTDEDHVEERPQNMDVVDGGIHQNDLDKQHVPNEEPKVLPSVNLNETKQWIDKGIKQTLMIQPLSKIHKPKSHKEAKHKSSSCKSKKSKRKSPKKVHISESQKEERKKKLKEIASKDKDQDSRQDPGSSNVTIPINAKVSSSNRGAFLTEVVASVKPTKRKENSTKTKKHKKEKSKSKETEAKSELERCDKTDSDAKNMEEPRKVSHRKVNLTEIDLFNDENISLKADEKRKGKNTSVRREEREKSPPADKKQKPVRVPLKNLKPLTDSDDIYSGKPVSKVDPLPKPKKSVTFSDAPPQVKVFEIEPGHQMKKTSLVKTTLLDKPKTVIFSQEKLALMKILRWNPQWLLEQINNNEPPPILGPGALPMAMLHYFHNHTQYVQIVGDLLMMEIWESLTQAFNRRRADPPLNMSIEQLPPVPSPERTFEIFNLSVNVSLPKSELHGLPRVGEVLLVEFGAEAACSRFFYVHNVRTLPSPPNNKFAFYSVALQTVYTERMRALRRGEALRARALAHVRNELALFAAMEALPRSPLAAAVLRPEPRCFVRAQDVPLLGRSQWTETLNESQLRAVSATVSAARGDRPSVQLVQGPPGTGKSSVICSMAMSYLYSAGGGGGGGRPARGKLLLCATSNAAIDALVIRLLRIRQNLPKPERFRMVRVGRAEAMHPRARDLSSQTLALRDAARLNEQPAAPAVHEELSCLQARLNMWQSTEREAKDPARLAYCQSRIEQLKSRIAQLQGGGAGPTAEQLALAERRIVEGADIIATTLASAAGARLKGLRGRIALCIVDEAGQAIEPETLIPLTLDVDKLTLVGDMQQLPGYIASQRAKEHGLGESLFARLASSMEHWNDGSPVVLLNQQYRMHRAIADYPNRAFYGGLIQNAVDERPPLDVNLPPYAVVSVCSGDKGQGAGGANETEARGVARLARAVQRALPRGAALAVVTPYTAQRDLVKRYLNMLSASSVEVNTVDSFQGQERDVILVSLARSHGVGFLTDAGRMNVMLTRAKHSLIVCLNPNAMQRNPQWRTLIEDAQDRKVFRYLPNKVCQPIDSAEEDHGDILRYISSHKTSYK